MAKFNPKEHLMQVKGGADYLPVAWRLVWFREEWPNGIMVTEPVEITPQVAIFKATVTAVDADGVKRGSATGYKTCTPAQFKFGYVEKAETGALGRALACLGYGTQFEPEFDEGDLLADSPVQTPQRPPSAPNPTRTIPPPINDSIISDVRGATLVPQRPAQAPQMVPGAPNPSSPVPTQGSTIASAEGVVVAQTRHIDMAPARDRATVMAALHADGKEAGLGHDDLHNLIVAKGFDSMTTAPVEALVELRNAIKSDPGKLKTWLVRRQEVMPSLDELPNPSRFTS